MIEYFLYTSLTCIESKALMQKIYMHKDLSSFARIELVETIKDSNTGCEWDAND